MKLKVVNTGSQNGNCYILENDKEALTLDAGCKYKDVLKSLEWNISKVCGVLVSHVHSDHSKAFKDFVRAEIPVYTNDETADHFEVITGEKMRGMPEKISFKCGFFTITPFYLPHTTKHKDTGNLIPCPNFGFHIFHPEMGQLVYMTDFEYPALSFRQARIEHLLCEVNYCDELVEREEANYTHRLQGHLSLKTFKEKVLKQNLTPAMQNIIICHLSDSAADEEQILREVKEIAGNRVNVNIAKAGLTIELNRFPF